MQLFFQELALARYAPDQSFYWIKTLLFHDGTEPPINRQSDTDEERFYYSGKKKQHTVKKLALIADGC